MTARPAIVPEPAPLVAVEGLRVALADGTPIVEDIGFTVAPGEIMGLVGESGSGKTTVANALLGHARRGARIAGGAARIAGTDMLALDDAGLRAARGPLIAYVAQDPATALNPALRVGAQLDEVLRCHRPELDAAARAARIAETAADVGLPATPDFLRRFPHALSGGQQQRVLLALGFVLAPRVIVLDEPTTALDVTTQAHVLATVRRLCRGQGIAAIYVSHDLAVVRGLVDQLVVLYAGRIMEAGRRDGIFARPAHPYTRGLLAAVPDVTARHALAGIPGHAPGIGERPDGCPFAPRCAERTARCGTAPALRAVADGHRVACHHPVLAALSVPAEASPTAAGELAPPLLSVRGATARHGAQTVLHGVDIALRRGECTAVVGESGSGKTTLARGLVGLGAADGTMIFDGESIPLGEGARDKAARRRIQYVFQNPYRALNPRQTVGAILKAAARHFFPLRPLDASRRVAETLERVALPAAIAGRFPRDLSGGERQRVAIARALICEPDVLICDEITSALDVSVQAAILRLLDDLRRDGLTLMFVTHDLAVVRAIADRVVVLRGGVVVEEGRVDEVLDHPAEAYTRALIADSPGLAPPPAPAAPLQIA